MRKFIIILILLAALPLSASARYYGGSHVSVGFGYGGYYPAPYYPAPVYYAPPPPVYVQPAPIVVQQDPYGTYARPAAPPPSSYDQGYCREYTRNVKINGTIQPSYGTACQQPDGSWATVN